MNDKNQLFQHAQARMRVLAYQLLGSIHDADDVLQEAWIRWYKIDNPAFYHQGYLHRIVVNLCLDLLRQRKSQQKEYIGWWLPEPDMAEDNFVEELINIEDQYQQASFAFLHVLEQLNPVERAVFVLRELFDSEFDKIAEYLSKTSSNCRQIYSRAKRKLKDTPARHETSADQHQQLLMSFLMACQQGNEQALQQLLTQDAILYSDGGGNVRAALRPIYSAAKTIRLLLALARKQSSEAQWQLQLINGRLAAVSRLNGQLQSVMTICANQEGIKEVFIMLNPEKLNIQQKIAS